MCTVTILTNFEKISLKDILMSLNHDSHKYKINTFKDFNLLNNQQTSKI